MSYKGSFSFIRNWPTKNKETISLCMLFFSFRFVLERTVFGKGNATIVPELVIWLHQLLFKPQKFWEFLPCLLSFSASDND